MTALTRVHLNLGELTDTITSYINIFIIHFSMCTFGHTQDKLNFVIRGLRQTVLDGVCVVEIAPMRTFLLCNFRETDWTCPVDGSTNFPRTKVNRESVEEIYL